MIKNMIKMTLLSTVLISSHAIAQQAVVDGPATAAIINNGVAINTNGTKLTEAIDGEKTSNKTAIETSAKDIIDALRKLSGQQTGNIQQRSQIDASMRETQDNRGVQQRLEGARYNAVLAASSGASGCNIITGIVGSSGLFNTQISVRKQLNKLTADYQYGASKDASIRNGTLAAQEERTSAICDKYSDQSMIDEGMCGDKTNPESPQGESSKALSASNIIDQGVLNTEDQAAARLFIGAAFVSSPLSPVSKAVVNTPQGRQQASIRWTSLARNSLATSIINDAVAMRTPFKQEDASLSNPGKIYEKDSSGNVQEKSVATVRKWAEGTAKGMLGGKPDGQNYPDGLGVWAWMDLRARSFYLDPNFLAVTGQHDMNQNSKDMVNIIGYQAYLQWEQFKQMEKTNLLLASIVSMMDQVVSQRVIGN